MPDYKAVMPGHKVAKVEGALTTKHARTAYLDYLSRNKHISWRNRGEARRMIEVSKWQDWMSPDITLDYDMIINEEQLGIPEGIAVSVGRKDRPMEDEEDIEVSDQYYFPPPSTSGRHPKTSERYQQEEFEVPPRAPRERKSLSTGLRDQPAGKLLGRSQIEELSRSESGQLSRVGPSTSKFDVLHSIIGEVSKRSRGL